MVATNFPSLLFVHQYFHQWVARRVTRPSAGRERHQHGKAG